MHEDKERKLCAARLDRLIEQQQAARRERNLTAPPPDVICRPLWHPVDDATVPE